MRRHGGLVRAVFELHSEPMPQLAGRSADEAASGWRWFSRTDPSRAVPLGGWLACAAALQRPPAILPHRRAAVRVFRHHAVLCDGQLLLGYDQFAWCLATAACMERSGHFDGFDQVRALLHA